MKNVRNIVNFIINFFQNKVKMYAIDAIYVCVEIDFTDCSQIYIISYILYIKVAMPLQ